MLQYFYSIKDISIGGRCMCNGHADTCDVQDPNMPKKLVCQCQHNTCGPQCATCCKGFEQKKWQQSTASKKFVCERKRPVYFSHTYVHFQNDCRRCLRLTINTLQLATALGTRMSVPTIKKPTRSTCRWIFTVITRAAVSARTVGITLKVSTATAVSPSSTGHGTNL